MCSYWIPLQHLFNFDQEFFILQLLRTPLELKLFNFRTPQTSNLSANTDTSKAATEQVVPSANSSSINNSAHKVKVHCLSRELPNNIMVSLGVSSLTICPSPKSFPATRSLPPPQSQFFLIPQNSGWWKKSYQNTFIEWGRKNMWIQIWLWILLEVKQEQNTLKKYPKNEDPNF